MDLQPIDYENL